MIELHISATSPQELIDTLNGLATLGGGSPKVVSRPAPPVEIEEVQEDRPQPEAPKTTRRRRTETAGAQAAEDGQGSLGSATPASTATPAATTGPTGDQFSDQIRQANAEAAEERETDDVITLDVVHQAFAKATAPGGKLTMMQAQNLLRENFTTATGEPARRLGDLLPKDYPAALKLIEG